LVVVTRRFRGTYSLSLDHITAIRRLKSSTSSSEKEGKKGKKKREDATVGMVTGERLRG
jgi:hypothetical protein